MKVNNNDGIKLVLYNAQTQQEKALNPYATKALFKSVNLYGETYETSDDYFSIEIENLKQVKINHIESNKKRENIFLCGSCLYMPFNKVLKHEIKERRTEYQKGCISISYDDVLTFTDDIKIIAHDSKSEFKRKDDEWLPSYRGSPKSIAEEIEKANNTKSLFKSEDLQGKKDRYIDLLEQKQKEGFDYICFAYRSFEKTTNKIYFCNCVSRYEKSKEYLHAEKIQKAINSKTYNTHQLSIYEILDILDICNITIKRR